MSVPDTCHAH